MNNEQKYLDLNILSKFKEGWFVGLPGALVIFKAVFETLGDLKISQPVGLHPSVPLNSQLLLNLGLNISEHLLLRGNDHL